MREVRGLHRPQETQGHLDTKLQGPTHPEHGLHRGVQGGMSPSGIDTLHPVRRAAELPSSKAAVPNQRSAGPQQRQ